ncbi:MAG: hypothetical protein JW798_10005 [Prolixibacteraceae bacterium]|nr:hypothetical protein [Prolixibacteraceae bacterium]
MADTICFLFSAAFDRPGIDIGFFFCPGINAGASQITWIIPLEKCNFNCLHIYVEKLMNAPEKRGGFSPIPFPGFFPEADTGGCLFSAQGDRPGILYAFLNPRVKTLGYKDITPMGLLATTQRFCFNHLKNVSTSR